MGCTGPAGIPSDRDRIASGGRLGPSPGPGRAGEAEAGATGRPVAVGALVRRGPGAGGGRSGTGIGGTGIEGTGIGAAPRLAAGLPVAPSRRVGAEVAEIAG